MNFRAFECKVVCKVRTFGPINYQLRFLFVVFLLKLIYREIELAFIAAAQTIHHLQNSHSRLVQKETGSDVCFIEMVRGEFHPVSFMGHLGTAWNCLDAL